MNENYDYQNNAYGQAPEPDYYNMYTNEKVKEAKSVFSRYFLALFLYLLVSNVIVFAVQIILIIAMGSEGATAFLNNNIYIQWLLGVGPMYFIGFPVFYFIIRKMKTAEYEKKPLSLKDFLVFFFIAEGAMYLGSIIGNMLNSVIGGVLGQNVTNQTAELIEKSPMLLIILIVVIIGPIIEELLFRKFMIDRFSRYGNALAIIVSAVSFGLFHGNFYQFFYAAMLGAILGYIYTQTRNVKYTIIMHMVINFIGSIIPMLLQGKMDEYIEMTENFANGIAINFSAYIQDAMLIVSYSIIQYVLMASGIIMFINAITKRKIKIERVCEYQIPKNKVAEVTLANVGVILFLILSLIQFALSIFI